MKSQCIFSFPIAQSMCIPCRWQRGKELNERNPIVLLSQYKIHCIQVFLVNFSLVCLYINICVCVLTLMKVNNFLRDDAFHLWEIGAILKASNNEKWAFSFYTHSRNISGVNNEALNIIVQSKSKKVEIGYFSSVKSMWKTRLSFFSKQRNVEITFQTECLVD